MSTVDKMEHAGDSGTLALVVAAVQTGATTWAAVAREANCSRTWAAKLGRSAGLTLARRPRRDALLHLRVQDAALDALDAQARVEQITRADLARQILSEGLARRAR